MIHIWIYQFDIQYRRKTEKRCETSFSAIKRISNSNHTIHHFHFHNPKFWMIRQNFKIMKMKVLNVWFIILPRYGKHNKSTIDIDSNQY